MTVRATGLDYAAGIICAVCRLAGVKSFVYDLQTELRQQGIVEAIDRHDTPTLFDWLATALSFQGVSDRVAHDYMARHGRPTWNDIARNLTSAPPCPNLRATGISTTADITRARGPAPNPSTCRAVPYPRIACATVGSTKPPTACSCSSGMPLPTIWSVGSTPASLKLTSPMYQTGLHGFDKPCCHL